MDALIGKLKPGGTLVVAAPDFGSFWRRLYPDIRVHCPLPDELASDRR
ncbi:hypothetical protein [Caballeronia zhejiangensis]|nr:hypothetical protein [Caballeronia zhejiangensis]